jgi:phospholipase C
MARVPDIVAALDADMAAGNLSQVSYLIAPAFQSEHAAYHPSIGEDLSARILKVVSSYPDLYAKTLFVLNYDEQGGFFDHSWTPTAPQTQPGDGLSTVNTTGEVTSLELPIGLGFRVPLLLVSPWTRGKKVISQVFDHTSVIKFLEQRFNVTCPNISPWRRAITGDLTLALDLDNPDYSWPTDLPDTSGYVNQSNWECANLPPPSLPPTQSYPTQEPGTRISIALPYEFLVADAVTPAGAGGGAPTFTLALNVTGAAAAPFLLIDALNGQKATPRKYAVAAGTGLEDPLALPSWAPGSPSPSRYAWSLHGPNGFVRQFGGDLAADNAVSLGLRASLSYDVAGTSVVLSVANAGPAAVTFTLTDNAYGVGGPWTVPVAANGGTATQSVNVSSCGQWYDLTATVASSQPGSNPPVFQRRFMGRMETGQDTISDPAMGNGVPPTGLVTTGPAAGTQIDAVFGLHRIQPRDSDPAAHPPVPESHRYWKRAEGNHKDARWHFTVPANMDV